MYPTKTWAPTLPRQAPEKDVILHHGYCYVHHRLTARDVNAARAAHPNAVLLAHPECTQAVLDQADAIGSTAQILHYAEQSAETEFIIATENGILHKLRENNPDKSFHLLTPELTCADMKKTQLADVRDALLYEKHKIELNEDVMNKARRCLERMLAMA